MPHWDLTIDLSDVFHNDDMEFEEKRDEIAARVRDSGWPSDHGGNLPALVNELATAGTVEWFEHIWNILYDYADKDRVWFETV